MSVIQNEEKRQKILRVFQKFSNGNEYLPNKNIHKFFETFGLGSDLFIQDFYYYFPQAQQGSDLHIQSCLAFLDYILTPKVPDTEVINAFKVMDKFCNGHIKTNEFLGLLRKEIPAKDYQKYAQLISSYGPSINYIQLFSKKK